MIYTTFAQLYDKLMDPQMYRDWVSYFDRYEFEKNSNILDLACGSGRFAVEIAKKGYDVTGFDLSEDCKITVPTPNILCPNECFSVIS